MKRASDEIGAKDEEYTDDEGMEWITETEIQNQLLARHICEEQQAKDVSQTTQHLEPPPQQPPQSGSQPPAEASDGMFWSRMKAIMG